jgi:hypothetical protein
MNMEKRKYSQKETNPAEEKTNKTVVPKQLRYSSGNMKNVRHQVWGVRKK